MAWVDGETSVVEAAHVDNLDEVIVLALYRGEDSRAYFVTDGRPEVFRGVVTALLATRGIVPPDRSVPGSVADPASRLAEAAWRAVGAENPPPLTRYFVDFAGESQIYDLGPAERDLGYRPVVTREEGLAEMAASAGFAAPSAARVG